MTRPPLGLLFAGFVPGTGYGNATRDYLALLEDQGLQVQWLPLQGGSRRWGSDYVAAPPHTLLPSDVPNARLAREQIQPTLSLFHTPREFWAKLRAECPAPRTLVYTTFEQSRLPELTVKMINGFDGVMVPSRFNFDAFRTSGVTVPIWIVPHVVTAKTEPADEARDVALTLPDGTGPDTFVVCMIGPWQARKAIGAGVEAFLRAFGPDDNVLLVIKTSELDYVARQPSAISLAQILGRYGRSGPIHLVTRELRYERLMALMRHSDCLLSLSRGEGFGLTIAEAIVRGTPVVTTGWSAPPEFLGADYPLFVNFKMIAVASEPTDGWADLCGDWAMADIDHAASLLQSVYRHRGDARRAVKAAQQRLAQTCAPEVVGTALLKALESGGALPRRTRSF